MHCHTGLLLAVVGAVACAPEPQLVQARPLAGPYGVRDGRMVDGTGAELLLRGVNLSQSAKAAPYQPVEIADAAGRAALHRHGPVALRYLTSWAAIEPEDGVFDEAYLAEMKERVGALAAGGHLIVLDLHQDLFGVGFPGANGAPRFACDEEAYASFEPVSPWFRNYQTPQVQHCFDGLFSNEAMLTRMAAALRRAVDAAQQAAGANLVGVDLINEPHPGSLGPAQFDERLTRYYQIAAEALSGTGVLLLFEPNVLHNLGEPTTFTAPPSAHAVFAPHLYPVDAELGRYQDVAALAGQVDHDVREAAVLGVPLLVGELGPLLTDENRLAYVDDVLFLLDRHSAGAFAWDWSTSSDRGFAGEDAQEVAERFLRPHARRVAGARSSQAFDPDRGELTLTFDEDGVEAASEIIWPETWGDVAIDVSDGDVSRDGDLLVWRHDPAQASHSLTLHRR